MCKSVIKDPDRYDFCVSGGWEGRKGGKGGGGPSDSTRKTKQLTHLANALILLHVVIMPHWPGCRDRYNSHSEEVCFVGTIGESLPSPLTILLIHHNLL